MINGRKKLLLCLTALVLLLTFTASAWAAESRFTDVKDTHWARPDIEEMNAAAVIKGYPDGTFKPNNPVSIHDTLVMLIRAKNLEPQTKNYVDRPYQYSPNLPEGSKGYLAMAAANGWINPAGLSSINRNEPLATRQEVAIILSAAFNLTGNGDNLPFKDTNNSIFQQYKNHIAGVYEAGLMRGRDATTFDPLAKVTRAELAAIFARMTDKGMIAPNSGNRAEGKISNYSPGSNQVTFHNVKGTVAVYTLADNVAIYDGSTAVNASSVANNTPVRVYFDGNKINFIKTITKFTDGSGTANPPSTNDNTNTTEEVMGLVKELNYNSLEIETLTGDSKTYGFASSLKIYDQDNKSISLLQLSKDAFVRLSLKNGLIEKIYLEECSSVVGKIYDIDNKRIKISKGSSTESFDVDKEKVLVADEDGDDYDYDDLRKGYEVKVFYNDDKEVIKIEVLDESGADQIIGTIHDLENDEDEEDDWEITIIDQYGDKETYDVDENVKVYDENGKRMDFEDLTRSSGEYVIVYLNSRGDVKELKLAESYSGVITDLDKNEIEINDKYTYDIAEDIDIKKYIIGSEVTVYIHDDEVIAIEVDEAEDGIIVPGEIYEIDEDDYEITIRQDSGNRFTFKVDSKVDIIDDVDDKKLDFEDLKKYWEVELELDDNEVVEITVVDK